MDPFKKKIIFFLNSTVGGGERMTITIAKMLPLSEFNVSFIIVGRTLGDIPKFIPNGYDFRLLKVYNMWDFLTFRLISMLKEEKPLAVFSTAMHLSSRLILAAKYVGDIKIVIRNCNYMSTLRWDKMFMIKHTYHIADWIIAQQDEMRKEIISELPKVNPQQVISLANPLDLQTINERIKVENPFPKSDNINFICVARFHASKGQDVLAKAFVSLSKINMKYNLWFIGKSDGSDNYVKYVKDIIKEGGCENRVHFVGFDSNPYRWIKNCDCFVLPSRIEGLPNSLLEAQYLARPCVATVCIPVIDRIIQEGINGYKVKSEDYQGMAKAMQKAIKLKEVEMTYKSASPYDFIKLFI